MYCTFFTNSTYIPLSLPLTLPPSHPPFLPLSFPPPPLLLSSPLPLLPPPPSPSFFSPTSPPFFPPSLPPLPPSLPPSSAIFLLDAYRVIYIWLGWWPQERRDWSIMRETNITTGSAQDRWLRDKKLALQTAQLYAKGMSIVRVRY